ncbi:hypothetical protein C2G38_2195647 [Gigaspora rosea]|uniref:Uncharacterized protein n=1 Tax=Gigaspora rosea TaxID=44941 RepID=A0A397V4M1_9GLOM|nr:hypothetical protein C2G38_2195647 [Gigaspora rosea]
MDQPCTHGVIMTEILTKQITNEAIPFRSGRSGFVFYGLGAFFSYHGLEVVFFPQYLLIFFSLFIIRVVVGAVIGVVTEAVVGAIVGWA